MISPFEGSGAWEAAVARYEAEGLTTSDAQAAADAEFLETINEDQPADEPLTIDDIVAVF